MRKGQNIAILLRDPRQLSDACRCGRAFLKSGAAVRYYCLCPTPDADMNWNIDSLLSTQAPCYTNSHGLALRYELECLPIGALIQGIESADLIIPI